MLRAVGFTDDDFQKPQIAVASAASDMTPCNVHLGDFSEHARKGIAAAGGKPVYFNTITVTDGISMGTLGMRYSLVSREVIADSIETAVAAEGFDGLVAIGGCDKNMPGCHDRHRPAQPPASSSTAARSCRVSCRTTGAGEAARHRLGLRSGRQTRQGRTRRRRPEGGRGVRHPGPGSCGGMYTANTMASAIEALGMSLPNSSAQLAISEAKRQDCERAGAAVMQMLARGIKPRDIMTREAFENAITVCLALGGSTNLILHLLAIAHSAGVA
jgi:dihydroxy-acid dehydratase